MSGLLKMSSPAFTTMLKREWRLLFLDPWLCSLATWVPLVLAVVVCSIFVKGIARELPIGIIDLDHSQVSRAIIRNLDASPALQVVQSYPDVLEGAAALRAGTIYAFVVMPEDLERNTIRGLAPEITAFVNSQFLLIGKVINSALVQVLSTFNAKVEVKKNLAMGQPVPSAAISSALPIGMQITPLFNVNTNYAQFLVSAILPGLWQILIVALTVLTFAAENRREGLQAWLADGPIRACIAKYIPLITIAWIHGLLFLSGMYIVLGWPMHGSWFVLVLAVFLTSCACVAAGSLFFLVTRDAARGLSLSAGFAAPALAFMGVTFPVSNMTLPAKIWRSLIPSSHYIEIQFSQVNYGAPFMFVIPQFKALVCYWVLFLVAFALVTIIAARGKNTEEVV